MNLEALQDYFVHLKLIDGEDMAFICLMIGLAVGVMTFVFLLATNIGELIQLLISIMIGIITTGLLLSVYLCGYNAKYSNLLYDEYQNYQYCIEDIINISTENSGEQYILLINKDGEQTKITLNEQRAKFTERLDPNSEESYYELLKNDAMKQVMLVKYRGTKEQVDIDKKEQEKAQIRKIIIK